MHTVTANCTQNVAFDAKKKLSLPTQLQNELNDVSFEARDSLIQR